MNGILVAPNGFHPPDLDPSAGSHVPGGGVTTSTAIGRKKKPGGTIASELRSLPPGGSSEKQVAVTMVPSPFGNTRAVPFRGRGRPR